MNDIRTWTGLWLLSFLGLISLGTGCTQDKHVYKSTVFSPKTIHLKDLVSKQIIWTKEIPVEHKLAVDLDGPGEIPGAMIARTPPNVMRWRLSSIRNLKTVEKGRLDLPGVPLQLMMELRPSPEYPPGYSPDATGESAEAASITDRFGAAEEIIDQ